MAIRYAILFFDYYHESAGIAECLKFTYFFTDGTPLGNENAGR